MDESPVKRFKNEVDEYHQGEQQSQYNPFHLHEPCPPPRQDLPQWQPWQNQMSQTPTNSFSNTATSTHGTGYMQNQSYNMAASTDFAAHASNMGFSSTDQPYRHYGDSAYLQKPLHWQASLPQTNTYIGASDHLQGHQQLTAGSGTMPWNSSYQPTYQSTYPPYEQHYVSRHSPYICTEQANSFTRPSYGSNYMYSSQPNSGYPNLIPKLEPGLSYEHSYNPAAFQPDPAAVIQNGYRRTLEEAFIKVENTVPQHCGYYSSAHNAVLPYGAGPNAIYPGQRTILPPSSNMSIGDRFMTAEVALCQYLLTLEYPTTVTHMYNPLDYARELHRTFLKKFCRSEKRVLFLGMNPGPFGMAQSGVPFGEVNFVRDWLGITGEIEKPAKEHPKKRIWGLDCPRSEVSGARFWGFFQKICRKPEKFFESCFVHNFCPLIFMSETGKNVTPPDMKIAYRRPLIEACDRGLCAVVRILRPEIIIGVGKFAEQRALLALKAENILGVDVRVIMHPSPANPAANKGWEPVVQKQLEDIGILKFIASEEEDEEEEEVAEPEPPKSNAEDSSTSKTEDAGKNAENDSSSTSVSH